MKYTFTTLQTLGKEPYTTPELCIYETPAEQGFQATDRADAGYDDDEDLGELE